MLPYTDQPHVSNSTDSIDPKWISTTNPFAMGFGGFVSPAMCQVFLPLVEPSSTIWTRRNGWTSLHIMQGGKISEYGEMTPAGLPYGSFPRLLLAYINTEAYKNSKRVTCEDPRAIDLKSTRHLLSTFRMSQSKRLNYYRLRDQLERLLSCVFTYDVRGLSDPVSKTQHRTLSPFLIPSDRQVSFKTTEDGRRISLSSRYLRLSESAYTMCLANPVPIDFRILNALRKSPFALDVYLWANHRCVYLKTPQHISWQALADQFGSSCVSLREFARGFRTALKQLHPYWPSLRIDTHFESGIVVYPATNLIDMTKLRL